MQKDRSRLVWTALAAFAGLLAFLYAASAGAMIIAGDWTYAGLFGVGAVVMTLWCLGCIVSRDDDDLA